MTTTSNTIGIVQFLTKVPALLPDSPRMLKDVVSLSLRRASSKDSIGLVFQRRAAQFPDRPFIRFQGHAISYRDANVRVNRYAHVLAERGVQRGDVVGLLLTNTPETLLLVLAAVKLGAAAGMLNYNQRGEVLAHSLGLLESRLVIVGADCQDAVDSVDGDLRAPTLSLDELNELAAHADSSNPAAVAEVDGTDRAYLIFTSGTTGMPKASVMKQLRWLKGMDGVGGLGVRLRGDDTLYCTLPLYHNNALTVALGAVLSAGCTYAIGTHFSASKFWDDCKLNKATAFIYIGELCRYLLNQPAKPSDADNAIHTIVGNGMRPEIWDEFKKRFGVKRVAEFYGASEGNIAFVNALNFDRTAGICPLPHAIVDYDDDEGVAKRDAQGRLHRVRRGDVGLLLAKVTDRAPFDGYTDPAASEKKLVRNAFADGDVWFDTGDLVRNQGLLHVAFVDRLGDTFRWKGENVATTEVEGAIGALDGVSQAVVFGVEVPDTGGKAGMAAVTLHEGAQFDGKSWAGALYDALPSYAVPLFVRVVDTLETTTTFKSRKVDLRKTGYGAGEGELYVLRGREGGYEPFYDDYPADVAAGKAPRG